MKRSSLFSVLAYVAYFMTCACAWGQALVDPAATTSPATRPAFAIVRGPYLQNMSDTAVTVCWDTNRGAVSRVEYVPVESAGEWKTARAARYGLVDAGSTAHQVRLTGLEPGKAYRYRVASKELDVFQPYRVVYGAEVKGPEHEFRTFDPKAGAFSFIALNDRHERAALLRQGLKTVNWEGVAFVAYDGDMINYFVNPQQAYASVIEPSAEIFASRIPYVWVRGNHETRGQLARDLMRYMPSATGQYYRSFDHGGVHFVVLDSGEDKADAHAEYAGLVAFDEYIEEEARWLEEDLARPESRDANFRVVLMHIPPLPNAKWPGQDRMAKRFAPLLDKGGVDLVLCGHTHRYAEHPAGEGGTPYAIAVGGTETIIRADVTPDRITLTTTNNDGSHKSTPPPVERRRGR